MEELIIESRTENVSALLSADSGFFVYTYGALNKTVEFQYSYIVERTDNRLVLSVDWLDIDPELAVADLQRAFFESNYNATVSLK